METRFLLVAIDEETDVVLVRKRTRRLAELIGFDTQDQTRITTAVSEIARNAFEYAGGGQVEFRLDSDGPQQAFTIIVRDRGPGIRELDAILNGLHRSATGMGLGITGARRLMDRCEVETKPGAGTTVTLTKLLPVTTRPLSRTAVRRVADQLIADGPADTMAEIRQQNQQIVQQMEELQARQEELQQLNQELQDTNRGVVALYAELDERADHLRRADELKSKFLSHMSHEFRTPLNSILALSRLLLGGGDGELNAEQQTQVKFVRRAAEDLTALVDDLLDLAKVEAGKTVVAPSEFTATDLFGALRGMLRPLLLGDAVALVFDEPVNVPVLATDEAKVSQILRNFISNAIKFTEQGEVRVRATADPVADTVTFSVRDTGIGIAPEHVELIFQEFGQVSHRLQSAVKGTGLGLPLARKLAELLGGRITVESTPGQGSTFSVTLPRTYSSASEPSDTAPEWVAEPGKTPVLMVEDNDTDALVMERILSGSIYQLVRARTVLQAQQLIRRFVPAAMLLDVMLMGDESWRLLMHVREEADTQDIPLIVLSATGEDLKAIHLGADEYLAKPFDHEVLLGMLDRLTGQRSIVKVLLVDDEEVMRYLARQLLPRGQFSLITAGDGDEGLLRLRENLPDVVLLDINMPGMDGYEFIRCKQDDAAIAEIPVIVLTSAVLGELERRALRHAAGILSKSELSAKGLIDTITGVLQPSEKIWAG